MGSEKGGDAALCRALRSASPASFPLELAVPLAKVEFVRALGLLTTDRYRACVQDLALTGAEGIHLHGTDGDVSFGEGAAGGRRLNDDGVHVLTVLGSGSGFDAMLEVEAGSGTGLGLHRLDTHDELLFPDIGTNTLMWGNDDTDLARISESGLVLVTEVSEERLTGMVFLLSMRSALFSTDAFAMGTFRVDRPKFLD
jgi:hypothetical protein